SESVGRCSIASSRPIVKRQPSRRWSRDLGLLERTSGANSAGNGAWVISRTALGSHLNFSTIRATGLAAATIRSATRGLFQRTGTLRGKERDIVNRHLRGEPTPLASPIARMRLLLILSWRRAEPSSKLYRKSWLLNDLIP